MPVTQNPSTRDAETLARGFGLIELIITIAIAAILLAIALPSFREIGIRMHVTSTTNDLVVALNSARAEAVKRGIWVAVIRVTVDWGKGGWVLEADTSNNNDFGNAGDSVLNQWPPVSSGYKVLVKVESGNDGRVVFGPTGALVDGAKSADINVCRPDGDVANSRWIAVSNSGAITSQSNTTASTAGSCGS